MKHPSLSAWLAVALALAGSLQGAETRNRVAAPAIAVTAPEPPEPPDFAEPAAAVGVAEDIAGRVQVQVERARRDAERHLKSLNGGLSRLQHDLSGAYASAGGPQSFRALVLPSAEANQDPTAIKQELVIMSRVLEKSLQPESERRSNPFRFEFGGLQVGGRNDLDALYLDGYGALFLLEVDYPLVAAPVRADKPADSVKAKDDTWEKARREVRGETDPDDDDDLIAQVFPRREARPFEAGRVDALRDRLLVALRQAHNLTCVRDSESVTLVISGSMAPEGSARRTKARAVSGAEGHQVRLDEAQGDGRPPRGGSVMTLRIRKADMDALKAGRINDEEFARKVTINTRVDGVAPSETAPSEGPRGRKPRP